MTALPAKQQLERLSRGVEEIVTETEFLDRLDSGQPLRVKAGFDPSAPDLHLGHTVLLRKLQLFQELGHHVLFLIGDFTGRIGDPSGRNEQRPTLSQEQVQANADTYAAQVFKILDRQHTEIVFNSSWYESMGFDGIIDIASRYTVARLIERDDFKQRLKAGQPISMVELLYPLIQGYDSVALKSDVELGGTDQTFNLLVGRELQRTYDQPPQIVMTLPLLEGLDGVQKMSKSLGNHIAIEESPDSMFGKVMSISDKLMWRYYELLTDVLLPDIQRTRDEVEDGTRHPKAVKEQLGVEIVTLYHGETAAREAARAFDRVIVQGELPEDMLEVAATVDQNGLAHLPSLLEEHQLAASRSAARRLIQQGAVTLNQGAVLTKLDVSLKAGDVLQVGKLGWLRVISTESKASVAGD